jgi:hypothetical protein
MKDKSPHVGYFDRGKLIRKIKEGRLERGICETSSDISCYTLLGIVLKGWSLYDKDCNK